MTSLFAGEVIVGSAIVKLIEESLDRPDLVIRVGSLVSSLARALEFETFD